MMKRETVSNLDISQTIFFFCENRNVTIKFTKIFKELVIRVAYEDKKRYSKMFWVNQNAKQIISKSLEYIK